MEEKDFLKFHNSFFCDQVDNIKQIVKISFTGEELHEYVNDALVYKHNPRGCKKCCDMGEIFNVKDKLPDVEHGSFLVYAPKSFPKNSRWLVAEYYRDVKGFYSESGENFMEDVTHWTKLPDEPKV